MFDSSFSMRHIFILARYWLGSSLRNSWASQARPPLPCHLLMWSNRYLAALFQSQARPPLPCHAGIIAHGERARRVSISGETTAPLPPEEENLIGETMESFNLRRDHRSLATSCLLRLQ